MKQWHIQFGAAMAVATPCLLTAGPVAAQKPETVAAVKATAPQARSALRAELRRLTPAQKQQIGAARIQKLQGLSGAQIIRARCFTHGVGCQGTSGFTNGVICCALKKTGI